MILKKWTIVEITFARTNTSVAVVFRINVVTSSTKKSFTAFWKVEKWPAKCKKKCVKSSFFSKEPVLQFDTGH